MYIRKNDNVKMLTGKDRGKSGKVIQVFPQLDKVVVEGLNMAVKNLKPRSSDKKGQKVDYASPVQASNVALVCPKCGKTTRMGHKRIEASGESKAKSLRVCKKCHEVI